MSDFTTNQSFSDANIYILTAPVHYRSTGFTFLCMLAGDAVLTLNSESFLLSDKAVILLHPEDTYRLKSDTTAVVLEVSFDYVFFKEAFSGDFHQLHCNSITDIGRDYANLRTHLANIATIHFSDAHENRFYLLSSIYQLIHYLYSDFINIQSPPTQALSKQEEKLNRITTYLTKNQANPLSLQDLATYMDFTPQYVEKLMKQALGCTFYTFLNQLRLDTATELIQYTTLPVLQISSIAGFPSLTTLNNLFQAQYTMSPEQYRAELLSKRAPIDSKKDTIVNTTLAKDFLANSIQIQVPSNSLIEQSVRSTTEISVSKSKALSSSWKDLINLGMYNNFESPTFRNHLMVVQSELKFKYGRVEGVLDSIHTYTANGNITYNFSKAYRIIDFLRTVHMYPHFELGNKSPTIYKDYAEAIPDQPSRSETIDHFNHTLSIFLMNCINRYGFQEVSHWRFEVWMAYNDFLTVVESPTDYVERFKLIYDIIKQHLPTAKVGGPGFNTFLPMTYFEPLIKELTRRSITPDFISFYLYPYIKPEGERYNKDGDLIILLSKDKNNFKKYVDQIKHLTDKYFSSSTPLYVTEYSSVIYSHNYINDSAYQAAFIIKETLDNFASVSAFSYWLLSDVAIEYEDAVDILFGGNGLISRDGIKKPSYHALSFLGSLGNRLIAKDSNYIVTASSSTKLQVLSYHYCYFNKDYCDDQDKFRFLRFPTSAFESLAPLDLTLRLNDLLPGTYTIRQYVIDQEHGNIMHTWLKLNSPHDLTFKDIEYLRSVSVPGFRIYQKEVTSSLEIFAHLNANDVLLTEIELMLQ